MHECTENDLGFHCTRNVDRRIKKLKIIYIYDEGEFAVYTTFEDHLWLHYNKTL